MISGIDALISGVTVLVVTMRIVIRLLQRDAMRAVACLEVREVFNARCRF